MITWSVLIGLILAAVGVVGLYKEKSWGKLVLFFSMGWFIGELLGRILSIL
ncbi:gp33 [Bacillus phage G]|uniref:Gp33 n=1 Tax=Bacillus phage G TaxID=2884420 RepID=G3MBA3_9CAUD|nr:gp33 [Bacillus phage G]AEO93304.1 gp33 [Bacillus phage G]